MLCHLTAHPAPLQAAAAKAAQVAEAKRLREEQQRQEAMQQLLEGKQ
jgi:hypothetical protein